jgi:hypothetical protein
MLKLKKWAIGRPKVGRFQQKNGNGEAVIFTFAKH